MTDGGEQSLFELLKPTVSNERLGTYLKAGGFNEDRALKLYVWNARIGESFHFPIQCAEVGLRNHINTALCSRFGPDWWCAGALIGILDHERKKDLDTARQRIANRGTTLCTPQIVATLSFGFWVGMLQPRYNIDIWSHELRATFTHLPDDKYRGDLATKAKRVADLRNRIWHHEPIMKMNLADEFREVMILLAWICPIKARWVRENSQVMAWLRLRP
jgi:hypothetical protein